MKKMLLMMVMAAIIAVPGFTQNLLVNGDFESGDLTGWEAWGAAWGGPYTRDIVYEPVKNGDFALNLAAAHGSFGVVQGVSVIPGARYRISGQWMGTGTLHWIEVLAFSDDGISSVYKQLDDNDPNDGDPAYCLPTNIIVKVDGWGLNGESIYAYESIDAGRWYPGGLHSVEFTATSSTVYVGLKAGTVGGNVNAYFDDFKLELVPEPSSLAALISGIGALGFRLRRKFR